jgi:hypothetical protein
MDYARAITSFFSATWACGQVLYWICLRDHTECLNAQFWEAFRRRFTFEFAEEER